MLKGLTARGGLMAAAAAGLVVWGLWLTPAGGAPAAQPTAVSAETGPAYILTAAHLAGAAGTNWRTDVEVHNPGATQAAFTIELLKRGADNTVTQKRSYTLNPGLSVRYWGIVNSEFAYTGAAALRVTATAGTVQVSSRTYNLMVAGNPLGLPGGATFGQFVPALLATEAFSPERPARLIQLSEFSSYRSNLGIVNVTGSPLAVRVRLYTAGGALLGTIQNTAETNLPAFGYTQIDKVFQKVTALAIDDGWVEVAALTTAGRFFAFASVIDNPTGDPIFVLPASPIVGPAATPTTPPVPTAVLPIDTLSAVFADLSRTAGSVPSLETLVSTLLTTGPQGLVNQAVAAKPTVCSTVTSGLKLNFGTGYTKKNGAVYKGSATITYSGVSIVGNTATGNWAVSTSGLTRNELPYSISAGSGTFSTTQQSSGKIVADLTISGTGPGGATASGSAHFDTAMCLRYPVSGQVSVTAGGKTTIMRFNSKCDGTFDIDGAVPYRFRFTFRDCNSAGGKWEWLVFLREVDGKLVAAPKGMFPDTISGTLSATAASFTFTSFGYPQVGPSASGYMPFGYTGTYTGTKSGSIWTGSASITAVVPTTSGSCSTTYTCANSADCLASFEQL